MECRVRAVVVGVVVALCAGVGSALAEPVKCQRSILKESRKFATARMKALSKCEEKVVKGTLPPATVCATESKTAAKLTKLESKLRAALDKRCGGPNKSCGDGDDDSLASISWSSPCPDFEGLGCTNAIDDCDDIGECLFCVNEAAVDQAIALAYDDLVQTDPDTERDLNKCQQKIGKEAEKLFKARWKALEKCWDQRHKGNHANDCPSPGDGKAAFKIAKAESKYEAKICKACGGDDRECGGGDDLEPGEIGFAPFCPNVSDCFASIFTLQNIVDCVTCLADFKVDCETSLTVPVFTGYPAGCPPTPPTPFCGDGTAQGAEECDDGCLAGTPNVCEPADDGDGCSSTCTLENTSAVCAGVPTVAGTALTTERIASGLEMPVHVTAPPLDPSRVFIVEQQGRIRIVKNGALLGTPFLAIESLVGCCGERGLLSLAFHPDYETNGRFFVNYTDNAGDTVIARYEVSGDPDVADAGSAVLLDLNDGAGAAIDQPFSNHNGGQIAFGPDGMLYVGMGDGGLFDDPLEAGQDDGTPLGKMLRLDVDNDSAPFYDVPGDNPNPSATPVPLGLVWSKGLRNPWRFSIDRVTDEIYVADVGQNSLEEISIQPAATHSDNYGWDVFEGRSCFEPAPLCTACPTPTCPGSPTFNVPVLEYSHAEGCSITGGFVYRGCAMPDLAGTYFYGDFCSAFIRTFNGVSGGDAQNLDDKTVELDPPGALAINSVSSFGEDARGELYIADYATGGFDGEVYKILPAP